MDENFKMIAKTFYGFEDVLSEELLKLGAQKIKKGLENRNKRLKTIFSLSKFYKFFR